MAKLKRFSVVFIFILCCSFLFVPTVGGQIDLSPDLDKTFSEITNEEKAILDELFILTQEIDEMNRSAESILEELSAVQVEISNMESSIGNRQENYDSYLKVLKSVLVTYQKNGPASSLEILLSAESLSDFLKRLNLLKDLSKNTEEILKALDEEKNSLVFDQDALKAKEASLEEKNKELQTVLAGKLQLLQSQQAILDSLSDEKDKYEERLNLLEQSWSEVKLLLSDMSQELSRVIYESNISINDFNLSLGLFSVKGSISDDLINEIVKNDTKTPELIFTFTSQGIQLYMPDYQLLLNGSMTIDSYSGCAFRYVVEEGTFYNFDLEKYAIQDLFKEGYLLIDFSKIVGDDITIKSVILNDGFIEFTANPFF